MAGTQHQSLSRQTKWWNFNSHGGTCLEQHQATKIYLLTVPHKLSSHQKPFDKNNIKTSTRGMTIIWIGPFCLHICWSLHYANVLFALNKSEEKMIEARLAASKGQPQVVTMQEKQTPPSTESLVKGGRIQSLMITLSLMWEITTSVGIPIGHTNLRSGAIPLTLNTSAKIARFHSAPLWRLLTSPWTMISNQTRTTVTRTPL